MLRFPAGCAIFALSNFLNCFIMMDKTSLAFLTNEWHNNAKDQVVLHAICNLISEPYTPVLSGISSFAVSTTVCRLLSKYGFLTSPTDDIGTCSLLVQKLMNLLIEKGNFSKEQLQLEINRLFHSVYTGDYIIALGPFWAGSLQESGLTLSHRNRNVPQQRGFLAFLYFHAHRRGNILDLCVPETCGRATVCMLWLDLT